MTIEQEACTTFLTCVREFQTLISGMAAIFAAIGTSIVIWLAAKMPISAKQKEKEAYQARLLSFHARKLSEELKLLASRSKQADGTIKVQIASGKDITDNTRDRTYLTAPEILDKPEIMALFEPMISVKIMNLHRLLEDHNFDMRRAGGAYGALNFQESILTRLKSITARCHSLSGELEAVSNLYLSKTNKKHSMFNN